MWKLQKINSIMLEVKACIPCMFDKKRHKGPLTAVVYCTTVYNLNQLSCVSHRSLVSLISSFLGAWVFVCFLLMDLSLCWKNVLFSDVKTIIVHTPKIGIDIKTNTTIHNYFLALRRETDKTSKWNLVHWHMPW